MKKKTSQAWVVAVSCAAILFGVSGIIANTISLFMAQFSSVYPESTMAQLALYFTIMTGTMAIFQPVARKLFAKFDTRIIVSIAILVAAGGFVAISFYTSYIGWLISGLLIGMGFSFIIYLMGPILVNNWFKKKAGTVLGVVLAFSNLGGAVFGTVVGKMIASFGWQGAMRVSALVALCIGLPFAIFGLRYAPNIAKGEAAYGEGEAETEAATAAQSAPQQHGFTFGEAIKTPWLWVVALVVVVCFFGSNFQTQAAKFVISEYAFDIAQAGIISTVLMVGAVVGKVLLGIINDKFGCGVCYTVGCGAMIAGIVVMVVGTGLGAFMAFLGAFLFGFGFATMSIAPPFIIKKVLGPKHFAQIYGYIASVGTLTSMFSSNIYAGIYTNVGSYTGGMIAASIALAAGIAVLWAGLVFSAKMWKKKAQ